VGKGVVKELLRSKGSRTFVLLWLGQTISLTGSGLTGFALGVWALQRTGSVTSYALISFFVVLPGIVLLPIAGALVDRWNRRWAMMLSDVGAGLCSLSIALLLIANRLEMWQIYLAMGISSAFGAFQWPAYSATVTLLVPKEQYGRASGMVSLGSAISQIVAPMLAGILVELIQVQGVILVDFATLLGALVILLLVRVPQPMASVEGRVGRGSLVREAAQGWKYICQRAGLLGLGLFFALENLATGIVEVLFNPFVLGFSDPKNLGDAPFCGGSGLFVGEPDNECMGRSSATHLGRVGLFDSAREHALCCGVASARRGYRCSDFYLLFLCAYHQRLQPGNLAKQDPSRPARSCFCDAEDGFLGFLAFSLFSGWPFGGSSF